MSIKGEWMQSDSAAIYVDEKGIIQAIKPDSHIFPETVAETVKNYVNDEIENFRKENHISKRAWNKKGVIMKETQHIDFLCYRLFYKKLLKECTREIKFSYQFENRI